MPRTEELREMIREIDQQIIEQVATRMEITDELARAKKAEGKNYWDEAKEKEVIKIPRAMRGGQDVRGRGPKDSRGHPEHIPGQTEAYRGMSHSRM